jgi:hypothetical protein
MDNYNKMNEYYKNLINIYANGGGWGGTYYGVFSKVINDNGFKNCAEVGIGYGFHAKEILNMTNVDNLYLIDPMKIYPNDAFVDDVLNNGGFENLVEQITKHLDQYKNRYTWLRKNSTSVTSDEIPDESLDAIFIDADHSYEAVKNDLNFWWNKLKKGGHLLGDDYNSCHPGTTKAVDEFALNMNLKTEFLIKENSIIPGYPIYRFIKTN